MMSGRLLLPPGLTLSDIEDADSSDEDHHNDEANKIKIYDKKTISDSGSSTSAVSCTLEEKPRNVRSDLWQKFKALAARTDELTHRSTERRIKELQRNAMRAVKEEFRHPDDIAVLQKHDVAIDAPKSDDNDSNRHRRKRKKGYAQPGTSSATTEAASNTSEWQDVKQYLGINDRLQDVSHGDVGPKTRLEKDIDEAVHMGEFSKAEQLSDQLANRQFGTKIAEAFDAKNYMIKKKAEEESVKAKRKKKLNWGFEHKHKWEMKANM